MGMEAVACGSKTRFELADEEPELKIWVTAPGADAGAEGDAGAGGAVCVSGLCAAALIVCRSCVNSPPLGGEGTGGGEKVVFSTTTWVNTLDKSIGRPDEEPRGEAGARGGSEDGVRPEELCNDWNMSVNPPGLLVCAVG